MASEQIKVIPENLSRVGKVRSQTPIMYMELGTMPPVGRKHMRLKYKNLRAFGTENPNNQKQNRQTIHAGGSRTPKEYLKNGDKKECIFPLQQQRHQFGVYLQYSH